MRQISDHLYIFRELVVSTETIESAHNMGIHNWYLPSLSFNTILSSRIFVPTLLNIKADTFFDLKSKVGTGCSVLHLAIKYNHVEIAKLLMKKAVNVSFYHTVHIITHQTVLVITVKLLFQVQDFLCPLLIWPYNNVKFLAERLNYGIILQISSMKKALKVCDGSL